jgi:hypothetical protein
VGAMIVAVGKGTGVSVAGIAVGMSVGMSVASAVNVAGTIGMEVGMGADSIGNANFPLRNNPNTSPTASTQTHPTTPTRPMMIQLTGFGAGEAGWLSVVIFISFSYFVSAVQFRALKSQ